LEEALTAVLSSDEAWKASRLFSTIHAFADSGRGVMVASPSLRVRLLEAAQAATEQLGRAEMLSVVARALPN
jgi:hypothetical protein